MVLESPFWLKYVPKSETFWSWVWNDISRFSSSYDSSVVLVLYSLYFDENLGDFRSNMFARIDNIMWWDGPFSTVLYLFFATGVAHSHKTDDEWPRKLSRPHPKDTQGRIPLNDKPYWEVSFFSLFFFFFSSFFLFLFLFFPLPPKGQNLPAAAGFEFQGVRTRPMNPKRLSSVLLCTHHLRGLTGVDECFIFWDECFNFLHGLFPYIRNPSFSTQESVHVPGILWTLSM